MAEEYLLAWNDHHSTFFTAMAELISGDVLTDVTIWAGQTMYSAHRLVLALSSSYFKFVVTGAAQEGKLPVIFLKDVTSRDFERLLSYMYHGEVSVPQEELLSLISAAKSLGIRGLAEEAIADVDSTRLTEENSDNDVKLKDGRGVKRESDTSNSQHLGNKKSKQGFPKLQHKLGQKLWNKNDANKSSDPPMEKEPLEELAALKPHDENVIRENDELKTADRIKFVKDMKERCKDKDSTDQETRTSPKGFSPFFEVNVKQEEDETPSEDASVSENAEEYLSPPPLSMVRRSLLPGLLPNSRHGVGSLPERRNSSLLGPGSAPPSTPGTITRNTGTCHFCGRSFMKNKQLMNHVCPMRPQGK